MLVLIESLFLGFVGGLIPGSIMVLLLASSIKGGFSSVLRITFLAVVAEVFIALGLVLVLNLFDLPFYVFDLIGIIGATVLIYFGIKIAKIRNISEPEEGDDITVFSAKEILLLSATNAPLYIFWVTICIPLIWAFSESVGLITSTGLFLIFFEIGWIISTLSVGFLFIKSKNLLSNEKIMSKVYLVITLFFFILATKLAYQGLMALLKII